MYRSPASKFTLDAILARKHKLDNVYEPIKYTSAEKESAKGVLERLLTMAPTCEITSIETIVENNYE